MADGEILSYRTVSNLDTGGSVNWAASGTLTEVLTIFGMPVNGLNVATSTTSGTVTTSTGAAGEVVTVTASADASSAESSSSSSSSGQHSTVGVAVGASVGAVLGIILLAAVGFVVWRRKRRQLPHAAPATTHELGAPLEVQGKTSTSPVGPPDIPKLATELDSSRYYESYELPADTSGGRGRDLA